MRQFFRRLAHNDRPAARAVGSGAQRRPGRCGFCWSASIVLPVDALRRRRRDLLSPALRRRPRPPAPQPRDRARTRAEGVRDLRVRRALSRRNDRQRDRRADPRQRGGYSERLRAMTTSLPQLRDLWIVGADGQPLVSGTVFPMPQASICRTATISSAHQDNPVNGPYVSRSAGGARRQHRTSSRSAASARSTASSPASPSFRSRRNISASSIPSCRRPGIAALLRDDGAVLARYPDPPSAPTGCRPNAPFMTRIKTQAASRPRQRAVGDRRPRPHLHLPAARQAADLYVAVGVESRRRRARLAAGDGQPSDLRHAGDAGAGRPRHHRAAPHRAPAAGGEPARSRPSRRCARRRRWRRWAGCRAASRTTSTTCSP